MKVNIRLSTNKACTNSESGLFTLVHLNSAFIMKTFIKVQVLMFEVNMCTITLNGSRSCGNADLGIRFA